MIGLLLDMLELDTHIGVSKNVDIAKGINKMPNSLKEGWAQYKRMKAWQM